MLLLTLCSANSLSASINFIFTINDLNKFQSLASLRYLLVQLVLTLFSLQYSIFINKMLLSCRARRHKATILLESRLRSYFDFVNLSLLSPPQMGAEKMGLRVSAVQREWEYFTALHFFIGTENWRNLCCRQNEPCICSGNGLAMSSLYPEMRFSWEIKSVDALFCNGLTRVGDLSKEAILQAIKDGDLRFLQVSHFFFLH